MIDHATKKKELIVKKIVQYWIGIFGHLNKILVDNGEGVGDGGGSPILNLKHFVENFNIRICTTTTESPWNNVLTERHNAILGLTVTKTIEDIKCGLQLAVPWAVSAKNSLKNVHGFSPSQFVFGKKSEFLKRM